MPQLRVTQGPNTTSVFGINAGLQIESWLLEPAIDGMTALAGGGQTGATQITGMTARIATVATAGDSVMLPQAIQGLEIMVNNDSTNAMNVFPAPGDTIDKAAANAAVSQMAQSLVIYTCFTTGQWRTEGLSTGFDPAIGLQTLSFKDSITANAGGGQQTTGPSLLANLINRVSVVATGNDSVTLPVAKAGEVIAIMNGAVNSLNVFPNTGDAINALGANAAFAVTTLQIIYFICFTTGQWFTK